MCKILPLLAFWTIFFSCKNPNETLLEAPKITSFTIADVHVNGIELNNDTKTIVIEVPYQTNLKGLQPQITVSELSSIVPVSGARQNFDVPVYYTLTSSSGQKVVYTVIVKPALQPIPIIEKMEKDTIEAGQSIKVNGRNFGTFSLDIQAWMVREGNTVAVKSELIDTTQVKLFLPDNLTPGQYRVQLKIRKQQVLSSQRVVITYPTPVLDSLSYYSILQGEKLLVYGKYIEPKYRYSVVFGMGGNSLPIELPATVQGHSLEVAISQSVLAGQVLVGVRNLTEKKQSIFLTKPLHVFDNTLPYLLAIVSPRSFYKPNDTIVFRTINFLKVKARFFQVHLQSKTSDYYLNTNYDDVTQQLTLILPDNISLGNYQVKMNLANEQGILYSFETNIHLPIH